MNDKKTPLGISNFEIAFIFLILATLLVGFFLQWSKLIDSYLAYLIAFIVVLIGWFIGKKRLKQRYVVK